MDLVGGPEDDSVTQDVETWLKSVMVDASGRHELNWAGQGWAGQGRAGQGRAGQGRAGLG